MTITQALNRQWNCYTTDTLGPLKRVLISDLVKHVQALERENDPQKKFWDQLGFEPKTF